MPLLDPLLEYVSATTLLVTFIAVYITLYIFSILYSRRRKTGRNPFVAPHSLNGERNGIPPLVTNAKNRDAVLKQAFSAKRLPEKIDVIVVGSGIGGLSAAALLARAGKRVVVLEQHDQAGGCCHTYEEKGFEFDVGIHYVGNMKRGAHMRTLFDQLTDGNMDWVELDPEYDSVHLGPPETGRRFLFVKTTQALMDRLVNEFPGEKVAIEKFFDILRKIKRKSMHSIMLKVLPMTLVRLAISSGILPRISDYFYYNQFTLRQVLDQLTSNDELKGILSYSFGDYGTLPGDTPMTMHSVLLTHFINGGFYPRGGASEIAFHIIPVIERAGGRVLVRANVTGFLTNPTNGRITGVRVEKPGGDVELLAHTVISAAGIPRTAKLLPPELLAKSTLPRVLKEVGPGVGALSLFVGLDISTEELIRRGICARNMWAFTEPNIDDASRRFLALEADEAMSAQVPLLFISFPSTKDPSWSERHPGKSTLAVITLARWDWFAEWESGRVKKRGADYEAVKAAFSRQMYEQTQDLFPQLRDIDVGYMELGTPVTNNYYINSHRGEIYGLDHNMARFSPTTSMYCRPDIGLPGLLISGQDILSCGFAGGLFGGVLCASHYLNRNLIDDLQATMKVPHPESNGKAEVNGKKEL